jgi:hypothetical protein
MNGLVRHAEATVEILATQFPDASFALFGSVARADETPTSDVDIFVLNANDALRPSQLLRVARATGCSAGDMNFVSVTTHDAQEIWAEGRLLALHLWREARILHDSSGELGRLLKEAPSLNPALEIRCELARISPYRDERPFNGNLLLCLAQDYSVGRSLTMLALAACGMPEFNRRRAFGRLRAERPSLQTELTHLESLEPFYAQVHGRGIAALPWSPLQARNERPLREHRRALSALDRLCETLADQ